MALGTGFDTRRNERDTWHAQREGGMAECLRSRGSKATDWVGLKAQKKKRAAGASSSVNNGERPGLSRKFGGAMPTIADRSERKGKVVAEEPNTKSATLPLAFKPPSTVRPSIAPVAALCNPTRQQFAQVPACIVMTTHPLLDPTPAPRSRSCFQCC